MNARRPSVIVVGGGIAGLTAAYRLRGDADVTVLEAGPRWGGKINTVGLADDAAPGGSWPVDTGPDALLIRAQVVRDLLTDLGLVSDLVAPGVRGSYLWLDGTLRPMPAGSLFGVPDRLLPLLRDRLVGPWGMVRAAADLVLPARRLPADPTLAQLLRYRFGPAVFDRLIEPMLGGVHAGRATRLSAISAVPEVYRLVAGKRSVFLALRAAEKRRTASVPTPGAGSAASGSAASGQASQAPTFPAAPLVTLRGGLSALPDALLKAVVGSDATARTDAPVTALRRVGDAWDVVVGDPRDAATTQTLRADHVVLAVPAAAAARLLGDVAGVPADVVDGMRAIEGVSVATATLAFRRDAVPHDMAATGFLVPPAEKRLLVGCSWLTSKWPHLRNDDTVLFRCMVGRDGDQGFIHLDDETLVRGLTDELHAAVGVRGRPASVVIQRWDAAMPQYTVGHAARVAAVDAALADLPELHGLHVTGSSYRGVGVASCIGDATAVAARILTAHGSSEEKQ